MWVKLRPTVGGGRGGEGGHSSAACKAPFWRAPRPSPLKPLHRAPAWCWSAHPANCAALVVPPCRNDVQSEGGDLAGVVAALKARHGLQYVYAWHAMAGFWGGLGLEGPQMAKFKARGLGCGTC